MLCFVEVEVLLVLGVLVVDVCWYVVCMGDIVVVLVC